MKKCKKNQGFTLVEMLACIITLLLIAGICSSGMSFALNSLNVSRFESDSQMLESTLDLYICDILRHATKIETEGVDANPDKPGEKVVVGFTNAAYQIYGGTIKVSEHTPEGDGGAFLVYETRNNRGIMIVGEMVYAETLYIDNFTLLYNAEKEYFTGTYEIKSTLLDGVSRTCSFTCRTIAVY